MASCATECVISVAHPTPCATERPISVAHILHAPQKGTFLWRMLYVRHRKAHFCGAHPTCATESHIFVAHVVSVRHRIQNFCGACKTMRHRNFFCGAWLFGAPQKVILSIAVFLVVTFKQTDFLGDLFKGISSPMVP